MKKIFMLICCLSGIFSGLNASTEHRSSAAIADFPPRLMEQIQKIKSDFWNIESKTDGNYSDLISADKYLLAQNSDTLSQIEDMEEKVDSKTTLEEVRSMDITAFANMFHDAGLAEEICKGYEALRVNSRYVFWQRLLAKLVQP